MNQLNHKVNSYSARKGFRIHTQRTAKSCYGLVGSAVGNLNISAAGCSWGYEIDR